MTYLPITQEDMNAEILASYQRKYQVIDDQIFVGRDGEIYKCVPLMGTLYISWFTPYGWQTRWHS